jgi:hypothetical protein
MLPTTEERVVMAGSGEKRKRGRPTIYGHAMTPAERQRRSRVEQKLRSPRRFVEDAQIAVGALRWTFARLDDLARDGGMDDETRDRLLGYCNDLRQTEKKIVLALKRVLRPPSVG